VKPNTAIAIKFAEAHRPIESITIDAETAADLLGQLEVLDRPDYGSWDPRLEILLKVLRKHRLSLPKRA
jgi:hypothetical protein